MENTHLKGACEMVNLIFIGMNKKSVSSEDLKRIASEHLSYEIEMFTSTMGRLAIGGLDILQKNVMLESFLIHARCLFDFLYPSKVARNNDVTVNDFFDHPSNFRKNIPCSLTIESYLKRRTGKEIAHLTYDRLIVTPEKKIWQVSDIHNQIVDVLEIFFSNLTDEQRGWFRMIVSNDGHIGE